MERQHTENLFRRFKGQLVSVKAASGEVYKGHVEEVTNDYVMLTDRETEDSTFVRFAAIESIFVEDVSKPN